MVEDLPVKATSIAGISKMFGLGKNTVRRAIRDGSLRASRIRRRVVITIADAELFIANGQKHETRVQTSANSKKSDRRRNSLMAVKKNQQRLS
jgi:hypothetical protein